MPLTPDAPFPKERGQPLRAKDWNQLVVEVQRLDTDKVNKKTADSLRGPLAIETSLGIGAGASTPKATLQVAGNNWDLTNTEGDLRIGNDTLRLKIGVAMAGGGAGDARIRAQGGTNRLMLGSSTSDLLVLQNGSVSVQGSLSVAEDQALSFGARTRQMIHLWGTGYGIGVQSSTQYARTENHFAWYRGGVHSDTTLDAGGGTAVMVLRGDRLGLGTTTPAHVFHVTTDAPSSWQGRFSNSETNVYLAHATGYGMHINTGQPNSGGRYGLEVRNSQRSHFYVRDDGNIGIGTTAPSHVLHVVAPGAVGLLESTDTEAFLRISTNSGLGDRVEITNRGAGRLTLWTAGAGDVFSIARNGQITVGSNLNGPFVRFNDDLWFSDPQNGTIQIRNAANTNWGTMVGFFNNMSSIHSKDQVSYLKEDDWQQLLHDTLKTELVTYKYKGEDEAHRRHLGVIAEESPAYLLGEDQESITVAEYVSMLHGAIKALAKKLQGLESGMALSKAQDQGGES